MNRTTVLSPSNDESEFWERYREYTWKYMTLPYYVINTLVLIVMLSLVGYTQGVGWKVVAFMLCIMMLIVVRLQATAISRNIRHRVLNKCKRTNDELGIVVMVYINMLDVTSGYFTSFADDKGVHIKQIDNCWVFKEFTQDEEKAKVVLPDRLVVDCYRLKWWYERG